MLNRLASSLLVVLAACGPIDPQVERGADEIRARQIVWHEQLNVDYYVPTVKWFYGTCPLKPDDPRTAIFYEGKCYSGLWFEVPWVATVAWRGKFSTSAYAHELIHAWQTTKGIYDPDHLITADWAYEQTAGSALANEGL